MRSKFLSLNVNDLLKGLLIAFLTALFTGLIALFQAGPFEFDWLTFRPIVMAAASAALAYLLKNWITNLQGQILVKDN